MNRNKHSVQFCPNLSPVWTIAWYKLKAWCNSQLFTQARGEPYHCPLLTDSRGEPVSSSDGCSINQRRLISRPSATRLCSHCLRNLFGEEWKSGNAPHVWCPAQTISSVFINTVGDICCHKRVADVWSRMIHVLRSIKVYVCPLNVLLLTSPRSRPELLELRR